MGDGRGGRWSKGEEEKRGGGERKGNEVKERERERRGVGGRGGQNQGDGRVTCFVNALKKQKLLQQPFRCSSITLYWIGEVISFPITSCLSIPIKAGVPYKPVLHSQPLAVVSAADHKPGDLCNKCSSVPMC